MPIPRDIGPVSPLFNVRTPVTYFMDSSFESSFDTCLYDGVSRTRGFPFLVMRE